ncbi:sterol desaturase family protein [Aestuariirhabdus sp. Z084]|uniref:sterol desaturase family protein n=1 Tax=Aestuariirhabdus haliotis TaxID=2918751 RepID=UPI00201B3CFE|nr:sterol desaturase family protein [Aestuariirhabdus haliotis]MCL6415168.1 sterol desaturase family protein [Aestuariirhabdus haliotis]MCL6420043.1 sterol desaturase family protein [Aestuariirhabdus haliotis]
MSYQYQEREVPQQPEKALKVGSGRLSGYSSAFLGGLSLLAVLAYLYPSYLTTTELRAVYNAETLQLVLKYGMWASLFFGVVSIARCNNKGLGAFGILTTLTAFALGGYTIPVGDVEAKPLALGIDWLILAFLGSTLVFTTLEKLFPKYRDQVILRKEWDLDFLYFCINHLLISVLLLIGNFVISKMDWAVSSSLQSGIQSLPFLLQLGVVVLVADFILYWEHRTFHEVKYLWPFHAVHHSVESMDWLAGSRSHIGQTIIERTLVMVSLYLIGVEKEVLDAYVAFAALQAIVIHCNMNIPWGPLKYIVVTPQYHHWHHSSEAPAIDTNYAAHTPLFDRLFNTYHMPTEHWPAHYGTTKRLPRTFFGQLLYPFRRN